MDSSYPKTLEAVAAYEGSAWAVADALVEEIAVNENGNVVRGEWPRVQEYLADNGYEVTTDWLEQLFRTAKWTAESELETAFRDYGPRSVLAAKQNSKDDHEFALEILAKHGGRLHKIQGSDPVGDVRKLTDEQVEGLIEKLTIHKPQAVAKGVKNSPKVQREIASDTDTMHHLSEQRMADAIARHREQHVEPTAGSVLDESPELRERLRLINTEAGEFAVIREGLRRFANADPEAIAERYIRIGAGLAVTVTEMESVEQKAGVVKDRLTAAVMQKEGV